MNGVDLSQPVQHTDWTPARELTDMHWARLGDYNAPLVRVLRTLDLDDGVVRVMDHWCRTHLLDPEQLVATRPVR